VGHGRLLWVIRMGRRPSAAARPRPRAAAPIFAGGRMPLGGRLASRV
jgi:hypothetical protein